MDPVRTPSTPGSGSRTALLVALAVALAFVAGTLAGADGLGAGALLLLGAAVAAGGAATLTMARRARSRAAWLERARATARERCDGDPLPRFDAASPGEEAELAQALNRLLDAWQREVQGLEEQGTGLRHRLEELEARRDEEQDLRERLERAERMESLGILAGGVAHDLNNLLGPLVGYPDLLAERLPDDDRNRRPLAMMKDAAMRSAAVIQDLLILAGRSHYRPESLAADELVREVVEHDEAVRQRLRSSPLVVEMEVDDELPPIVGSDLHLKQVLRNLVLNAIESMSGAGQIRVMARDRRLDGPHLGYERIPPGRYVVMSVMDQGPGLECGHRGRIFEPFYSTKKMGRRGSGLGLAVVWGVIKDHGGYVDVESTPGEGSCISFWLPERSTTSSSPANRSLEGAERILVIDDEEVQLDVARAVLESLGYRVDQSRSLPEALERLDREAFDLVILDLSLERQYDGLDALARIRLRHPRLCCIVATGFADESCRREALHLGARDLVAKPYTRETIGTAVRRSLDSRQATPV